MECDKCKSSKVKSATAIEGKKEYPVIICSDCGWWGEVKNDRT